MKITRRIKKYFVMAAAVLAVVIGVQSVSVPIGIVNAVQESSVADIVADEVEEDIEPPEYSTKAMYFYKAMESIPTSATRVLLGYDDYVLPVNTSTAVFSYYRGSDAKEDPLFILWDTILNPILDRSEARFGNVGRDYAKLVNDEEYYNEVMGKRDKEYDGGQYRRGICLEPYRASSFNISIDNDNFCLTEEQFKTLNPGYIQGSVNSAKLYFTRKDGKIANENGRDIFLQLRRSYKRSDNGILMESSYQIRKGQDDVFEDTQLMEFWRASDRGKGWYYILDPDGAKPTLDEDYNTFMIHLAGNGRVYGALAEDIFDEDMIYLPSNIKNRQFKIFVETAAVKYTAIPNYTVKGSFDIKAGKYGDANGGTDKTDGIMIPKGVTLIIDKGAVMTVSGHLVNNGTIINKGTIVIQNGGCIAPFRPGTSPSENGCGTIKCIGGDIVILKGGALYAGMGDDNGADVPFYLDSNSTLINKGLLVYGTMNLGQSARLDLHDGSKTYGSWYTYGIKDSEPFMKTLSIKQSYSFEKESKDEKVKYFGERLEDVYRKEGLKLVSYEIDSWYSIPEGQLRKYYVYFKNIVLAQVDPLEQLAFSSVFNDFFMKGNVNKNNVPQMRQIQKKGNGSDFGICVNSTATGKYAPHILKTKNAYINDPNMDTSVKAEAMTL